MVPDSLPEIPPSTKHFAMLFLGACIMFAGIGAWFAMADMDYHFEYKYATDEYPRNEGDLTYYPQLNDRQRGAFHGAVEDGERHSFDDRRGVPAPVIKRNDTYYVFRTFGYYDWLDPVTLGPTALALLGMGVIVDAGRRDVRYRRY